MIALIRQAIELEAGEKSKDGKKSQRRETTAVYKAWLNRLDKR